MKKNVIKVLHHFFSILIILLAIASTVMIVIGIRKLYIVDKNIKDRTAQVEERLHAVIENTSNKDVDNNPSNDRSDEIVDGIEDQDTNNNLGSLDNNNNMYSDDTLLIFKLKADHKTAVFTGVTEENLKYGSARLEASAFPGQVGNCIIFGHRDSSFKAMKYLSKGDTIEVLTLNGLTTYTVDTVTIAAPTDEIIYQDSDKKMLTLVTCYPFVLSGPADERCVAIAFAD